MHHRQSLLSSRAFSDRREPCRGPDRHAPVALRCRAGVLMSRKARRNLVSVEGIGVERAQHPYGAREIAAGVADGPAGNQTARRVFLQGYLPRKMEAAVVAAVRPQMIDSILDVDFTTQASDKAMAHAYFLFANWCIQARGAFDSERDMDLDLFDVFRADYLKHYGSSSESTHMAALKRVLRKRRIVKGRSRKPATRPLSQRQWMGLRKAASEAGGLATDARTLLVLAGGLGMSSGEIAAAKGAWVRRSGTRTSITITDKNLGTRELPVFGPDAEWLRARSAANPTGHIFRPGCTHRTNPVGGFVAKMTRAQSEFKGFTAAQARHMWLLNLMTSAVPFHVVCAMAGLKSDSNLAADLIAYAPAVATSDMRYHLEPAVFAASSDSMEGNKS